MNGRSDTAVRPTSATLQQVPGDSHDVANLDRRLRPLLDARLLQRLNYLWLAAIVAILISGNVTAIQHHSALWPSWRGVGMLVLSLAFLGWYLLMMIMSARAPRVPAPRGRRLAAHAQGVGLACAFMVAALLIALDGSFAGLTYALLGASMFLPFRTAVIAVGIAVVLDAWALDILPPAAGHTWMETIGSIFTIAISVALVFAIVALIRTNIQRARLLEDLSTAHRHLRLAADREADLATMRERNRLAREMHDSLGHALVSIAIKLEAVRLLYPRDPERATTELDATTALVRATMTELRHSLAGLRPAALEEQSLQGALAELTRDIGQRGGIAAEHNIDAQATVLDRGVQEAVYRVSQEALTNVAKHAAARHVALSLAVRDGAAVLEVSDDGVGLEGAPYPGSGGIGILGMRERIEALGGTLTIDPRSDRGTVLRARIPVRE